jgi:fumarate hydratase class II
MEYRIEKDTMGEVHVPINAYYGAQTQRSIDNFKIAQETNKMPKEIIKAFAYLKKAAAITNKEAGVLSEDKCLLIGEVCDEILEGKLDDYFPLVVWQTGSGTQSNMNVNEVVAYRGHVLKGGSLSDKEKFLHPNDDVNKSQSSNDTFPTAMHISAYKMLIEVTLPGVEKLRNTLEEKSKAYMHVVKIGRTHFMDATPLTVGQEFSGYVSQLNHGIKAIKNTLSHLSELALGGTAVGTGLNAPKGFDLAISNEISAATGIAFEPASNKFEALASNDALVQMSGTLNTLAVALTKIANDIRLLGSGPRSGLGELHLPENEPGSSIMPGKVNPTQCEMLTMVAAQVIGNHQAVTVGGLQGHLQLNVLKPMIGANVLRSIDLLAIGMDSFALHCVAGLEPDRTRIADLVERSLMLVTALAPIIGYDNAAKIAKGALREGTTLRQAALASGLVDEATFDTHVRAEDMV